MSGAPSRTHMGYLRAFLNCARSDGDFFNGSYYLLMKNFIHKHALFLALAWTAVIFALCCTPGRYVPTAHWLDLLSFDKLVHASIFFVLSSLWFLYLITTGKVSASRIAVVIVTCIAYGGMLEVLQANVFSQRSGDWADFIANSFGCLMALWFFSRKKWFDRDY